MTQAAIPPKWTNPVILKAAVSVILSMPLVNNLHSIVGLLKNLFYLYFIQTKSFTI
jgi:hypothetical protein